MPMYVLNTCIMIPFLKGKNGIQERISEVGIQACHLPEVVLSELLVGAYKTGRKTELDAVGYVRSLFKTLPLTYDILDKYAQIRALLEKQGCKIDNMDLLIAATAMQGNYTLVTHNIRHFSRVPGLKLEDWIQDE